MTKHDDQMKNSAIDFYRTAYMGNPKQAAKQYLGDTYTQHNPLVGDGVQAFIEYFERMNTEYPDKSIVFLRAITEGDLVALHTLQTWPDEIQYVTMDFFRFDEHGKIVEHWDTIQEVPKESMNGNTMY